MPGNPSVIQRASSGLGKHLALSCLAVLIAIPVAIWLLFLHGFDTLKALLGMFDPVVYWVAIMAVMASFLVLLGVLVNKRLLGALIDSSTNAMSLSRFQVASWTILVWSAYLMIAIPRIFVKPTAVSDLPNTDEFRSACKQAHPDAAFVPTVELCGGGPLQITFPTQLVLALGISLGSFAGSHLIQNSKKSQEPDLQGRESKVRAAQKGLDDAQTSYQVQVNQANSVRQTFNQADQQLAVAAGILKVPPSGSDPAQVAADHSAAQSDQDQLAKTLNTSLAAVAESKADVKDASQVLEAAKKDRDVAKTESDGSLHKNPSVNDASWVDMFRGNLVSTYTQVDFGKVQMFIITVAVLLAYGAAIGGLLHDSDALRNPLGVAFPVFSDSLNGLLLVSHGAYLTTKASAQA